MIVLHTLAYVVQAALWPFTYMSMKQIMKYTWMVSWYAWRYGAFITVGGPIWVIISFILYGADKRKYDNGVTGEVAAIITIYLAIEATSVWFVWKFLPYAAFYYEWDKYTTIDELIEKENEIRGYKLLTNKLDETDEDAFESFIKSSF